MATVYADECCMCPPELGCLGIFCPKRSRRVHVCDICGETITEDDGYQAGTSRTAERELCAECARRVNI